MLLHRVFRFRDETDAASQCITRVMGSVTDSSELMFEFGVHEAAKEEISSASDTTTFPFQVQIEYTKPNGMQCLRVQTNYRKATHGQFNMCMVNPECAADQAKAEETMDVAICSANAAQQSARAAQEGDYEGARITSHAWRNYMGKVCATELEGQRTLEQLDQQQQQLRRYCNVMQDLDGALLDQQREELSVPTASVSHIIAFL